MFGKIFTAVLFGALLASQPAKAQAAAEETPNSGNWLVTCTNQVVPERLSCTISQSIISQQTAQRIALLQVSHASQNNVMEITVPFGAKFADGLTLSIDGHERAKVPFQTANPSGIYTSVLLTPDMLDAMKKGSAATVGIINTFGQKFNIEFSLIGFSKAFELYTNAIATP